MLRKHERLYKKFMENILENHRALKYLEITWYLFFIFNKTKRKYLIPEIDIENKIKELKSKERLKNHRKNQQENILLDNY